MSLEKGYYVGLDVGSGTCGWAVVEDTKDSQGNCLFKLARLKGKDAWGARIFDDASDAKERRMRRANKRRINRRKYRIFLLNKLFSSLINPIDDTFFLRLSESTYLLEDRSIKNPYLFLDKGKEKEYYKKFPTIWHLRKALIGNDQYALSDIRFVYLAIHHIIKYRGNFLKEGTIDVYVDEMTNKTYVVEAHKFFSCGLYGFSDINVLPIMFWRTFKSLINKK